MKKLKFSLIIKITGLVFVAFLVVLGNEIRLGIDRYIKNTLETDANASIKDLDKFYKSYSESTIMSSPDFSSENFTRIYGNALSGDSTRVKCLTDKQGKIIDISREQVGTPMISITIKEYKGSTNLPVYFDLDSLSEEQITLVEKDLRGYQNELISAEITVEASTSQPIEQYNNMSIKSIALNGEVVVSNENITSKTETIEGIINFYSSYNLEITFPPINLESYNKSRSTSASSENIKTIVYDYQNTTNGLKDQISTNFKNFTQSGKTISTSYADYYLLKPYEYNGKYYSTIMIRLLDTTKIDSLDNPDFTNQATVDSVTAGYIFAVKEYENLEISSMQQFIADNSSTYFLAFILIVIICLSIAYIIVKPIRLIETTAQHIARKEFDYPIDTTRHDELGDLARSIDLMSWELEKTITNLHQEVERVQQMESLRKEFVSNFTHEIKTPLGIINGFSELVELEQDEAKRNEYIHIIQGETKRINELVLAMLDLSKLESQRTSLDIDNIDLLDIVDSTLETMMYLFEKKNIHLITELDSAPLLADQFKMEMVINNYISNALRYTEEGKEVIVHLDEHYFSVENEGQHVPTEDLEKIWYTFHKVDKSRNEEGTGLGLAICKAILELHHYEYGVENTEKGVLFYIKY